VTDPRNVTPEDERLRMTRDEQGHGQEQADWGEWTVKRRGRSVPWFGILLILIGGALLLQLLLPTISAGTLVLLAVGIAFLTAWIFGRSWFAMVAGVLSAALGVAELIEDLALLGPAHQNVNGLWAAALAVGFLVIWLFGLVGRRRSRWPLLAAVIFGLIGAAQLSGRLVGLPALDVLWPVVIIVVGLALVVSAARR
jgi:hypothetical protein